MRLKKTSFFSRLFSEGSDTGSDIITSRHIGAFLLFMALLSLGSPSFAATIICRSNKSVRTLRSDKANGQGCRAVYTKEGVDQVVGSSMRETGCITILATIRKTLEAHAWKCKDTKSGAVSNLTP